MAAPLTIRQWLLVDYLSNQSSWSHNTIPFGLQSRETTSVQTLDTPMESHMIDFRLRPLPATGICKPGLGIREIMTIR